MKINTNPVARSHLIILGATGSLGRHVLEQALAGGHDVSVFVRNPSRLSPELRDRVSVHTGDLNDGVRPDILKGHDALINCAGYVGDGQGFVELVDRVVGSVEPLHAAERPVCWFLAGVAVLDIDASGRRGVDLPQVKETYWPHRVNFERLERSPLDWRLLCPGPMVEQPAHAAEQLRTSIDCLPVELPGDARDLPDLELLATLMALMPQMIVPYADAAALMLANLIAATPWPGTASVLRCRWALKDTSRNGRRRRVEMSSTAKGGAVTA
jgi:hypothetical protein